MLKKLGVVWRKRWVRGRNHSSEKRQMNVLLMQYFFNLAPYCNHQGNLKNISMVWSCPQSFWCNWCRIWLGHQNYEKALHVILRCRELFTIKLLQEANSWGAMTQVVKLKYNCSDTQIYHEEENTGRWDFYISAMNRTKELVSQLQQEKFWLEKKKRKYFLRVFWRFWNG